jgi:hypothetical protein
MRGRNLESAIQWQEHTSQHLEVQGAKRKRARSVSAIERNLK